MIGRLSGNAGLGFFHRTGLSLLLALWFSPPVLATVATPSGDLLGSITYQVTDDKTVLVEVAQKNDLGILAISAANPGVDIWVPGAERLIVLPTAHILPEVDRRGIVINLAELRLYLFRGDVVETHAIGVGREGYGTPVGTTQVVRKTKDPTWRPTADTRADRPDLPAVVPPGPDNPLGRHAIYLGWPTYLIHGTNKPFGVGRRVSRGCIRMYPEAVADLFGKVGPNTRVQVINEPVKLGWSRGELFIEAHPDIDQLDELEATYSFSLKPPPDIRQRIIAKAGDAAARIDWDVVEAELMERRGIPAQITRGNTRVAIDDGGERPTTAAVPGAFTGLY
ncbi:MAG: L,D-transpeptidase family protein [Geminicoccaceae bacterium]|nr:L,D-transpeptidase family protein [Geminicoccaceae bacterium]